VIRLVDLVYIHSNNPKFSIDTEEDLEDLIHGICELNEISKIICLRTDSEDRLPRGLSKIQKSSEINCICTQADILDPGGYLPAVDPKDIWLDHIETIALNSGINLTNSDCIFLLSTGNGWTASLLYLLFELSGGKGQLWVKDEFGNTSNITRTSDTSSDFENLMASVGKMMIESNQKKFKAIDFQGNSQVPHTKGVENVLRSHPQVLSENSTKQKEKLIERRKNLGERRFETSKQEKLRKRELVEIERSLMESKTYEFSQQGILEAYLRYCSKFRNKRVYGQPKGTIVFHRLKHDVERTISYLNEHLSESDKICFILVGYEDSIAQDTEDFFHRMKGLDLLNEKLIIPDEYTSSAILFPQDPSKTDLLGQNIDLLFKLIEIYTLDPSINWHIDYTSCLATLRPSLFQFSFFSGTPIEYNTKVKPDNEFVFTSGLSSSFHTYHLPTFSEINEIRQSTERLIKNPELSKCLLTIYDYQNSSNTTKILTSTELKKVENTISVWEFNQSNYNSGDFLFFEPKTKAAADRSMARWKTELIEDNLIQIGSDKCTQLTKKGRVISSIICSRINGE